jgi:hypothetical protein
MKVLKNLREAARKAAQYRQIVSEIENMPLEVALDVNIYRGDAHKIARQAVYG